MKILIVDDEESIRRLIRYNLEKEYGRTAGFDAFVCEESATYGEALDKIRGGEYCVTDRAVDVQILSLRKKLGDTNLIETLRGVGYRFKEE